MWAQILVKNYKKLNLEWKGASDHQNLTEAFFAFLQDITMVKKWFISAFPEVEKISQTLPQSYAKNYNQMNLQWKGASDPQNLTEPFFIFLQDITMLKNWFISTFPEMEKISQNVGPN